MACFIHHNAIDTHYEGYNFRLGFSSQFMEEQLEYWTES